VKASKTTLRSTLVAALSVYLAACASPSVTKKSESPRGKSLPGQGDYQWETKTGWVRPTHGTWGQPSQIRTESKEAFEAGAYADALDGLLEYRKRIQPDDATAAETAFLIAECYYFLGNYEKAIEYYREVYQKHKPEGDMLNRTFQRIHDIALDYLREKAACTFLIFTYNCPSHGIDLLIGEEGLLKEYPNLPFADDALYEIGKYYFDSGQYAEAVPIYERIVSDYPQSSDWRGPAEYHLALATFKQVKGVDYDEKILEDAERKFRQYLESNPRGPQAEDARAKLREITEMLGEKNLRLAKFYLRESEPSSAKIYLRVVLERYTTSTAAREAREIQTKLEKY